MAPFGLISVGNVMVKTLGLFSSTAAVRCSCIATSLKLFSTSVGSPPKRPLTAYVHYVKAQQSFVLSQNPDLKSLDIIKVIAKQWTKLTPEEKQPFVEMYLEGKEQYRIDMEKYQAGLTPDQSKALLEEKIERRSRRAVSRKKRELIKLGKPKRPRSAFNIFMAEYFRETKGPSMQGKMKSLVVEWKNLIDSQKQVYRQLAEDDKVRYMNEMKVWEGHMIELGREDLLRHKERKKRQQLAKKDKRKLKPKIKVLKANNTKKTKNVAKTKDAKKGSTAAKPAVKNKKISTKK